MHNSLNIYYIVCKCIIENHSLIYFGGISYKSKLFIIVEFLIECVKKFAFLNLTQTRATSYNAT